MSETTITPVFVDWVTATGGNNTMGSWLQKRLKYQISSPTQRAYHRSHAVQYYPSGWRHYFTPDDDENPAILVADGDALSRPRKIYDNDFCLKQVAQIARASSKFTRVDLTLDIVDRGNFAVCFYQQMAGSEEEWPYMFPRRRITLIKSKGETVYVGSRQSPLMLRIYNKAAQTKGEVPTSRIELEIKGHLAREVHRIMAGDFGWSKATQLYKGFMRSLSTWEDVPEISNILTGEVLTVDKEERETNSDVKAWLTRQVLPSFVRMPAEQSGELWSWFKEQVDKGRNGA